MAKRLQKILPPQLPTRGPWRWFGNTRNDDIYLAAPWGGRHLVMSFRRWGMANAQPCFYAEGLRQDIGHFVEYERHYRDDVIAIDHPDARLIAAAPEMLQALQLVESVYRLNCVAPGEPSSVLTELQRVIALAQPQAVDAVDPPVPLRESRPRATETLPAASRGGGDTRPPLEEEKADGIR